MTVPHSSSDETPISGDVSPRSPQDVDLGALLDSLAHDPYGHAACPKCYACLGSAAVYVAACGRLASPASANENPDGARPFNACPACLDRLTSDSGCPVCGFVPCYDEQAEARP